MGGPLLVAGGGPLVALLSGELRRARRRFTQIDDLARSVGLVRRAGVLILTAPLASPDPDRPPHPHRDPAAAADPALAAALAWIVAQCRNRPRQRPPLRLLLISDGPLDWPLPEVPDELRLCVEAIDLQRQAARRLLVHWPLHWGADPLFGQRIHLVIAGQAAPVPALLPQVLRVAQYGEQPALVTLLGEAPEARRAACERAWPQAHECAELRFLTPDDPRLTNGPTVTQVIVCIDPPARGLEVARTLSARLAAAQRVSPPLLLEVGDAEPAGAPADWDGQIYPFSYRRVALAPAALLDGTDDAMAQVIHEHYRDTTEAQGRDPMTEASGQPWGTLAGSYRDANRHQADHLWAKLALTDCRARPEELVESFAFSPVEVERLAVIEHRRWAADRWLDGWTYAPERDNARKHHPQLIPFADLSGPMKDLDRFAVRLAPTLLARSGRGVLRMLIVGIAPNLPPSIQLAPVQSAPVAVDAAALASEVQRGHRDDQISDRLLRQVLDRLSARYPDRALVIATTLADHAARRLARMALDDHGAALFVLSPAPIGDLLDRVDAAARGDLVALLARAERRIGLVGDQPVEQAEERESAGPAAVPVPEDGAVSRWLRARAEILVQFHTAPTPAPSAFDPAHPGRKQVIVDQARGVEWGFEY